MTTLDRAKAALKLICEEFDLDREHWEPLEALIAEHEPVLDADVALRVQALRESTVDYDGSQMPDGAEPRRTPTCGEMRQTADMLERLSRGRAAQKENK